eukprot:COSAG02_NODE_1978_length_10204_cov_8.298268_8_plen_375_part_00
MLPGRYSERGRLHLIDRELTFNRRAEHSGANMSSQSLVGLLLLLAATAVSATTVPPRCQLGGASGGKPAAVFVDGYGTSAQKCIGAQGHDAKRNLAVSIDCAAAKLNVSAAAAHMSQLCNATPGCVAFSIISPTYNHKSLLCEIHPETIAQSSQVNQFWSVWQKTTPPKPGAWPYAPGEAPPAPPAPVKPIQPDLAWTTAPNGVTESMPLANGKLGVNVWADSTDTLWLLVSHVDALDENTNLDKLGRVKIEAALDSPGNGVATQTFRQEMHVPNATVSIDLTIGVSIDVWVDATSDAVRIASRGPVHKLQATLELWRNSTSGYPSGVVNGSVVYKPPLGCPTLHPNSKLRTRSVPINHCRLDRCQRRLVVTYL